MTGAPGGVPGGRRAPLALLALAGAALGGCYLGGATAPDAGASEGGPVDDSGAGECPNDLPGACPSAPPRYLDDVAPVVARACASCHSPGGVEANHDFTTYDGLFAEHTRILSQVYSCRMPPPYAPSLTAAERAILLAWLVCGAPGQ